MEPARSELILTTGNPSLRALIKALATPTWIFSFFTAGALELDEPVDAFSKSSIQ